MLTGSCMCGKVRYEVRDTPFLMYRCHCGICRKMTGTAFTTNATMRREDFAIVAGEELLARFESSPRAYRYFCSGCGSPIYGCSEASPAFLSIRCGTLDGDPGLRPMAHFYVGSKAEWDEILDDLPQHDKGIG